MPNNKAPAAVERARKLAEDPTCTVQSVANDPDVGRDYDVLKKDGVLLGVEAAAGFLEELGSGITAKRLRQFTPAAPPKRGKSVFCDALGYECFRLSSGAQPSKKGKKAAASGKRLFTRGQLRRLAEHWMVSRSRN